MLTNYHSHTNFCDGSDDAKHYAEEALKQGLLAYGYSSHVPMPFYCAWSMKIERLPEYLNLIKDIKKEYESRLQIYTSLEIDYIPNLIGPNSPFIKEAKLDYTIGSVHFVDSFIKEDKIKHWEIDGTHHIFLEGLKEIFQNDIRKAVTRYFELTRMMVQNECPDVIGHIDKIKMQNIAGKFYSEDEDWYKAEMLKTLETIASTKAIIEVNTRGLYKKKTTEPYPGLWTLKQMKKLNIPAMLNSDSHHQKEITACFDIARAALIEAGYKEVMIFLNNKWQSIGIMD